MLEQQKAAFIVEHKRAGSHGETALAQADESATNDAGKETKDRPEEFCEHERE